MKILIVGGTEEDRVAWQKLLDERKTIDIRDLEIRTIPELHELPDFEREITRRIVEAAAIDARHLKPRQTSTATEIRVAQSAPGWKKRTRQTSRRGK